MWAVQQQDMVKSKALSIEQTIHMKAKYKLMNLTGKDGSAVGFLEGGMVD